MTEAELEAAICAAYDRVVAGQEAAEQREAFEDLRGLVARRSPETIQRMEAERGLR